MDISKVAKYGKTMLKSLSIFDSYHSLPPQAYLLIGHEWEGMSSASHKKKLPLSF